MIENQLIISIGGYLTLFLFIISNFFQNKNKKITFENCVQGNRVLLGQTNPLFSLSEEQKLKHLGADFVRSNRGGLITFHGPGQLVAYPILNLNQFIHSEL